MAKKNDYNRDLRLYGTGAKPDIEKELLPDQGPGLYYDALNMRPDGEDGSKGASSKSGYALRAHGAGIDSSFFCMDSVSVNNKKVEFWVHVTAAVAPQIKVDGVTVAQSEDLPFVFKQNFSLDRNENCVGGEVFVFTEGEPLIFNVDDMLSSLTLKPDKYFSDFNKALYSINLSKPLDIPVFVELVNTGGGGGMPPGSHRYSTRYINEEGDETEWSPYTPFIPVPANVGSKDRVFNFLDTIGSVPNPEQGTSHAIKIRSRITNILNYEIFQIKRQSEDLGSPIGVTPPELLIAQIPISEGQISVLDFVDPVDSTDTEVLEPLEAQGVRLSFINSAKTGRYFKRRLVLMNIKTPSRDDAITYTEKSGEKIYPVITNLGKTGLNDAYNATYYKPYMNGERFTFGAVLFDGIGGFGFVREHDDLKNFEFPNRRDVVSQNTKDVSYRGVAKAVSVDNVVDDVHEVFDLVDAVTKTDKCNFKNIYDFDSISLIDLPATFGKSKSNINQDASSGPSPTCGTSDSALINLGANKTALALWQVDYKPYTPVKSGNSSQAGKNYIVNTKVEGNVIYAPKAFEPNNYSMGVAVNGVEDIPSWAKAFAVTRTKEAGRVVCQGLATYSLVEGQFDIIGKELAEKKKDEFWFFSPDISDGLVSSSVVADIAANPQNYEVQFVAPLGFFSEMYGFEEVSLGQKDKIVDMVTYARIIQDNGGTGTGVNPGEHVGMGINDGSGNRYVGFGKYRNSSISPIFTSGDKGNNLFSIDSFSTLSEGRGSFNKINIGSNLYQNEATGGSSIPNATFNNLKEWHEPFYIVNIVQTGKNVPDSNINQYQSTGHYQKVESIIGEGDGTANQEFILVDERWEDCIPALDASHSGASSSRFVFIRNEFLEEEIWMDVTFRTSAQIITINDDIILNGFHDPGDGTQVMGLYTHTNEDDRFFNIVFDQFTYYPQSDSQVIVKYESSIPIRVYGGNITIADSVFAPIDKTAKASDNPKDSTFQLGVGFPFIEYKLNPRHYVIVRTAGSNRIQDSPAGTLAYIRQMVMMFTCQTKSALNFPFGSSHFPQVNYIIRPNRSDGANLGDNLIFSEYSSDYGASESESWNKGGFRFLPDTNIDYMKEPPIEYFAKPKVGFEDETEFCTRIQWSLTRNTAQQDAPSLKTFLSNNLVDISDDMGEIKLGWDALSGKGENLYAFTENGICLLITDKNILSDLTSDEIGLFAVEGFINAEYWLDKTTGIDDEFYRASVGTSASTSTENGKVRREMLFFMNKTSIYRFVDNSVTDILKDAYFSKFKPVHKAILSGYETQLTMGYDYEHDELYIGVNRSDVFVFNQDKGQWVGRFSFPFDSYMNIDGDRTFGSRGLETYELNEGTEAYSTGLPPSSSITQVSSMKHFDAKDFPVLQINSSRKPTKVEILEADIDDPNLLLVISSIAESSIRNYTSFQMNIPRRDDNGDRVQGRVIIYKIYHEPTANEKFRLISTMVSDKPLN